MVRVADWAAGALGFLTQRFNEFGGAVVTRA